ncbi:hypothetical protein [Bacillus marinisedimentorum]|uniref:hypothetical protein n=1 Tax=Bacillus marinisedimentorum TaxID=1821260 RepID=UPI0008728F45|nr:hypothetical protein [Bacillus marinisedimentorum]
MKSKRLAWFSTFFISLIMLVGIYFFVFDFQYIRYEITEQDQLVIYEGLNNPMTVMNSDVSNEEESLAILDTYMEHFNRWVLAAAVIAPFFIAAYVILLSEKFMGDHPMKKNYILITVTVNAAILLFFAYLWLRYAVLVNEAVHEVLF